MKNDMLKMYVSKNL